MLSYWRVSDCDSVRSARQMNASSSRSLGRRGGVKSCFAGRFGRIACGVPYADDDYLIIGDPVEYEVGIGDGGDAAKSASLELRARIRMLCDEGDHGLQSLMNS